ncbi:hypothetical protein T08_1690 [Trichinella sp. T8]|nr:hypothetical protein T08_1690 [Trichinella sp. T8]
MDENAGVTDEKDYKIAIKWTHRICLIEIDLILQVKLPNHIMKPTLRKQIKSTLYFLTPSDDN